VSADWLWTIFLLPKEDLMARSKGPCHSLSIKLGQSQQEVNLLRKQLAQQQASHDNVLHQFRGTWAKEIAELKAGSSDVCALRDLVVAYDNLYNAITGDDHTTNEYTMKCLSMLRNSLWEAATGLGVKRV
jgi:molecular chaperone GrpE (heat shock protein)